MVAALSPTRLTAPDIAGAAGDAGEAADAASFASLLDAHGFDASASEAAALLPQFTDADTRPTDATGDDTDGAHATSSDDDPSRVNEAAFLVLTVAFPQPSAPPVTVPRGDAAESTRQGRPDRDGVGPTDIGVIDASQAERLFGRLRHLRLVASDRGAAADSAGPDAADLADVPPGDDTPPSSDGATAARGGPLQGSSDDRVSDFVARMARASQGPLAQKQTSEVRDAVPGDTRSAADQTALDAAAITARRAVDLAWNAQVTPDRLAARDARDPARLATTGETGVGRVNIAASTGNEGFTGFQDERGGTADARGNAPGNPFTQTRSASPIAGLRPLHTLVPVAFDVARDTGALSAATTAASSALPNEDGVSTSIVQALRLQVTAGGGSATITLDPSYLGGVRVAVQVADGAVTATLHASNPQVRAWMEANESTLRQALLDHGLTLDRLIVADDHGADLQRDPNPQYDTPGDQPPPRQRRHDSGERFEVVV